MAMQTPAHVAGATPPLLLPLMPPEDDPVVDPEDDPEDPPEPLPEPLPELEPEPEPLELPPGSSVVFPPHAAKVQPRSSEARTERRIEDRDMGWPGPLTTRVPRRGPPQMPAISSPQVGRSVRHRAGVVTGARDPAFTQGLPFPASRLDGVQPPGASATARSNLVAFGFVVFGHLPYGRVETVDGTRVLTTFGHLWFLPLIPSGSYVERAGPGPEPRRIPIGQHGGSILAAYLRVWCPVFFVIDLMGISAGVRQSAVTGLPIWTDLVLLVGAVLGAWLLLGRLSPAMAAQRRVYGKFAGLPVDVARFSPAQASDLREALAAALSTEGRAFATGYRDGPDPRESWREVALSPQVEHRPYLEAALTRARLERRFAPRRERGALADVHARIWAKLARSA
jgi:hypothetical protein